MRACIQRVHQASVSVANEVIGQIDCGLLVLLGVGKDDTVADGRYLAEKIATLRVFDDESGKMNRSLQEINGGVLVVSQFTLFGDCRQGRRPGYSDAAPPELAEQLYEQFVAELRGTGLPVATGRFRTTMDVSLVNAGPVTLLLDSRKLF